MELKTETKAVWLVVSPKGYTWISGISYARREAIKAFLGNGSKEWAWYRKEGWKCIKVNITITPV